MKGKKHSAEQIIKKLREAEAMIAVGKTIGGMNGCNVTTTIGKMGKTMVPSFRQVSGKSAPAR